MFSGEHERIHFYELMFALCSVNAHTWVLAQWLLFLSLWLRSYSLSAILRREKSDTAVNEFPYDGHCCPENDATRVFEACVGQC